MHIKSGAVIDDTIVHGLLRSNETGEALLKTFIDERLISTGDERGSIFKPVKNPMIKTGLQKPKKVEKAVNVLKEEKQAFGLLVGKSTTAEEAHSFPLTSVPLALASPEGTLRQSNKSGFRNHLIEEGNAVEYFCYHVIEDSHCSMKSVPSRGDWIIRSVTVRNNWRDYGEAFLAFCCPPINTEPNAVIIVMDTYGENRVKEITQKGRGEEGKRIHITGEQQNMPSAKDWPSFLQNAENKINLISFLANYYKKSDVRASLEIPLIITEGNHTWKITRDSVQDIFECNHVEADTRVVLHASESLNPVRVVASDTDILLLQVYTYSQVRMSHSNDGFAWYMKIDSERFVNVSLIYDFYGYDICNAILAFHSLTGFDTTSYPFGCGKVKPFKKMLKQKKFDLIEHFGLASCNSDDDFDEPLKFFQTIVYNGNELESLLQTRIAMYDKQREKSSLRLIPDISSCVQHVKRAWLQTNTWVQCMERMICHADPKNYGWQQTENGLKPIWFICPQLPPSLKRKERKRPATKQYKEIGGKIYLIA